MSEDEAYNIISNINTNGLLIMTDIFADDNIVDTITNFDRFMMYLYRFLPSIIDTIWISLNKFEGNQYLVLEDYIYQCNERMIFQSIMIMIVK